MSSCSKYRELMVGRLGGPLDPAAEKDLREHCALCPSCAEEFALAQKMMTGLADLKARPVALPDNFDAALHLKLVEMQQQRSREGKSRSIWGGLRWGLVALGLVMTLTVALFMFRQESSPEEEGALVSRAEVSAGRPITIELAYEASQDIDQVTVTIELDEGLSFHSAVPEISSRRTLAWTGPLVKGVNTIPFVVTVDCVGVREIRTNAAYEGLAHRHRVVLAADGLKVVVAQYRLRSEVVHGSLN